MKNILDLIGKTPILTYPLQTNTGQLTLKLESWNPTHSMKDRMALNMVEAAEKTKKLLPGGTIIESSSGNTATSLAMIAAVKGYNFIAVVDDHCAIEKLLTIEAYGGSIHRIISSQKGLPSPNEREAAAHTLAQQIPNAFWTNQADNPANAAAYSSLAHELMEQVPTMNVLFGALGTGGSLSGTARALRAAGQTIYVVGVEPDGSTYFSKKGHHYFQSGTGNPPGASIPKNFDTTVIDEHFQVTDAAAFTTCAFLAKHLGLLVGGSSGGLIYIALQFIAKHRDFNVVVIIPDAGEKYLSTVFSEQWLHKHRLLDQEAWNRVDILTKKIHSTDSVKVKEAL